MHSFRIPPLQCLESGWARLWRRLQYDCGVNDQCVTLRKCKTVPRNIDDTDRLRLPGIVLNSAAPHDVIQYTTMHVSEKILKVAGKTLLYSDDGERGGWMAIVHGRWNKDGKPQGGGGNYGSDMGKFHLFPPIDLSPGGRTIQSSHFMRSARGT